ncbi:MAG: hypothetical protein HYS12_25645 [Planctomycetes bacterium]|nr:hypothetical protein [Planctomycetota bacterium]
MRGRGFLGAIALGLVASLLPSVPVSPADADVPRAAAKGYAPVAPVSALHAALESNLKQVRSWLDDGDFDSAEQTAHGLAALAWLHGFQGEDAWRRKTSALRDACAGLSTALRRKNAAACDRAMRACSDLLAELAKMKPAAPTSPVKDFRPPGPTKTWMLLMDGAYVDGKTSTSSAELERQALVIAEEVNVVTWLRADPRWRKMTGDVRAAALLAAETARKDNRDAARKAFKTIYTRCEACHNENKR